MNTRNALLSAVCLLLISPVTSCAQAENAPGKEAFDLVHKVDPLIGTAAHGHTYPGVTLPFGMVHVSPDTYNQGWDWCSGYHYTDGSIMGFSHTHLSGTGSSDYGDFLFMPTVGDLKFQSGTRENPDEGYRSRFSHAKETAYPGYYSVNLSDYAVQAELTATTRVAMHRYTYPATETANVIIDLTHFIERTTIKDSSVEIVSDRRVQGYARKSGWANDRFIYFTAEFSRPFADAGLVVDDKPAPSLKKAQGTNLKAYVRFDTSKDRQVLVKVAVSSVSCEGAANNLKQECPGWEFEAVKKNAMQTWQHQLAKFSVEGGSETNQRIFYTALYHSCLFPHVSSDVDGRYRGMDKQIHTGQGDYYTIYSLWDTFRSLHPLMTIIEQNRTNDFINAMLTKYDKTGRLPKWELASNEAWGMIGYHAVSVIADAWMKGIRGYDGEKALKAMVDTAMQNYSETVSYRQYGYVPMDKAGRSASRTVEFAYDDWCIAQMAKDLGQQDISETYTHRSKFYRNLHDPETGFLRGKSSEGLWASDFNPNNITGEFVEGNAWHYTFFAPHDMPGLMALMGGEDQFVSRLDAVFAAQGREHMDVSGLIGQYAHGNEPCHNYAYLYAYAGQPWKTQEKVAQIVRQLYTDKPDGICGNEDCGQMSAWYVLNAMGFYPVCPGQTLYVFGTPLFPKATVRLESGKTFEILAKDISEDNIYIQSAILNGTPYSKSYIEHADINKGGKLILQMGPQPNKSWGQKQSDRPYSQPGTVVNAGPRLQGWDQWLKEVQREESMQELAGQIRISAAGTYTFKLAASPLGRAELFLGNVCVAADDSMAGQLEPGTYPLRVRCLYPMLAGRVDIQVKTPDANRFESIERFVLLKTDWQPEETLSKIPAGTVFIQPDRLKYVSLATGKSVTCSGGTQSPNEPKNAVDGDVSNRSGWHSGSAPQWLQVDLGQVQTIDTVKLYTYYDNNRYYRYFIEVSSDGEHFTQVVDQRKNTTPSSDQGFKHSFEPVKARYVRVTMVSNSANPGVHVNEVLVY